MSAPTTEDEKKRQLLNEAIGLSISVSRVETHIRKHLDVNMRVGKFAFPVVTCLCELIAKGIITLTAKNTLKAEHRQLAIGYFRGTPAEELELQPWWC
ncbi:MAG: hypothetical protein P1U53_15200, partial [Sulfitobacter sp.]|nr:hypothetical protein [Sulfitobacter sp.]